MPLSHDTLIDLSNDFLAAMGLPTIIDGLCGGFTDTFLRVIIYDDQENFIQAMNYLHGLAEVERNALIAKFSLYRKQQAPEPLSAMEERIYRYIIMIVRGQKSKDYGLNGQHPILAEVSGPLDTELSPLKQHTNAFTEDEFRDFLMRLVPMVEGSGAPFAITLSIDSHTTLLWYDQGQHLWCFCDLNCIYTEDYQKELVVQGNSRQIAYCIFEYTEDQTASLPPGGKEEECEPHIAQFSLGFFSTLESRERLSAHLSEHLCAYPISHKTHLVSQYDSNLLQLAAYNNDLEAVTQFCQHANAEQMNHEQEPGATALYLASQEGHVGIVDTILSHDSTNPNLDTESGATPLSQAINNQHPLTLARLLQDSRVNPNVTLVTNEEELSVLMLAAIGDEAEHVRALLSCPRIEPDTTDVDGNTALHLAIVEDCPNAAHALLNEEKHCSVNLVNALGETPLYLAVQARSQQMVLDLIAAGADNRSVRETTPEQLAISLGELTLARLIRRKRSIDVKSPPPQAEAASMMFPRKRASVSRNEPTIGKIHATKLN